MINKAGSWNMKRGIMALNGNTDKKLAMSFSLCSTVNCFNSSRYSAMGSPFKPRSNKWSKLKDKSDFMLFVSYESCCPLSCIIKKLLHCLCKSDVDEPCFMYDTSPALIDSPDINDDCTSVIHSKTGFIRST